MSRLPRIAYVLTQDRGGPVDVTVALARSLHERGAADVRVYGPRPARGAETVEPLLHPTAVPAKTDVAAVARVRARLRSWRPDVVHAQDRRAGLTCAGLSRSAGVGSVVHTYHGVPDDVTQEWLAHGTGAAPSRYTLATLAADAAVARAVDCTVAPSPVMVHFLRDRLHAPARRLIHIDNGLALPAEPTSPTHVRELLCVALLVKRKGVDVLLEAMTRVVAQVPDVRLRVAGDGPQRADLQRQVGALGLTGHVELLGFRSDVPALMAQADLFVLPSRMEQQPLVLIEAMAAGALVVATNAGGVADMLTGLDAGTAVVPVGDADALAQGLLAVMATADPACAGQVIARSAHSRFSVEACAARHLELYDRLRR